MYLKNLTVLGFKSFADKTSLNFMPGMTAIVGPNGCGKSNVSDAIRWVLGEQSAKALRGGEMADVIFTGTDGRKPLGMAEVSLTIGEVEADQLTAAGVELGYNEVTVTRRVFRDGGSEYFINKTPCRLRDIQQLFMGTGVGRTSYSIMAQGNITQLLSSKPEDRRAVFEEAAGITKFKAQKKEALRKLEYTDQNLLRVDDLIREVKRQLGSLQRQAGKARRYRAFAIELQHLDTQLARHQFDVLQAAITERQTAAESLRNDTETLSASVLRAEDEILQLRGRLSDLEHEISSSHQQAMEIKAHCDRHDSCIRYNEERLLELEQQNARALGEIAEAEERARLTAAEVDALTARLADSQQALARHRTALEQKQAALQQVESDLLSKQEMLRNAQSSAFAAMQQLSRARNEINALDLQKQGNVVRLEKLSSEKIQLEEERTGLQTRLAAFAADVETRKLNAQNQRGTVEDRQQRLREIHGELNQSSQELDALLHQQAGHRSRLTVLEQLDTSHEGFSAGALAALQQTQSVLGSLADKIRVPDAHVLAVEAALGHHLQLVLTEQPESAQLILSGLAAERKGRASIAALALRVIPPDAGASRESENADPAAIVAASVVTCDDSIRPLIDGLLGRTRIVADLAAATLAMRATHGAFNYVTKAGELLNRHGIYTGGYANGNGNQAPASILGRKNQIADLQQQIANLHEQVNEGSRRKGALQSEQTALQATLQEAQTELRAQEVSIAAHEGEFNALQASLRSLHSKIETVVYEIQALASHEREGEQKRAVLSTQIAGLDAGEQRAQSEVTEATAALEQLRSRRDGANAQLTEARVALAAEDQLCASLGRQKPPLDQRLGELSQLVQQRRAECASFLQRQAQSQAEVQESRHEIERLSHERELVNAQTAALAAQKETQENHVVTREENLRIERRRLTDLQQERSAIEVDLAQKTMSVQNLRERIQQKYQVNLDDIRSECITITVADEGPPKVQTLTPEQMASAGVATDWDLVAGQVLALQQKIDEMGPVNLVAIEEYEETEQRHDFLSKQNDDLVQAKVQLLEVINRINAQTQEMFTETFNKIRENFQGMFTEIFGGGKADLQLVDAGDVLESGIDIMARPPGKQLQSISLLSGGEQTMTAVALLFSIYQVKPSPFCVLDELDAPLDESNVTRFVRILQRFLAQSQFIVITHNKRTIGMADVLYGVTMQERGISRIVSVKFHKADEQTSAHPPNALVQTPANDVESEEDKVQSREDTVDVVMAK
ncbi:MAG: chromosome segregation protein [Verrucomicrobiota bacterium]|jgi:chromosome segregation protein